MRARSRDDAYDDSIISPVIVAIEEAAEAAGWGCVEPLTWLGRSALLQRGQARIAIVVPRRQAEVEKVKHQGARLTALGIRGLWLVPPGIPPNLVDNRALPGSPDPRSSRHRRPLPRLRLRAAPRSKGLALCQWLSAAPHRQ